MPKIKEGRHFVKPAEIGERFGMLVATGTVFDDSKRKTMVVCRCDCGGEKTDTLNHLRTGFVSSCGCKHRRAPPEFGAVFGMLTYQSEAATEPGLGRMAVVKCECGNVRTVVLRTLVAGKIKSCGCRRYRPLARRQSKYGQARRSAEFTVWIGMMDRTTNPKSEFYDCYGGRGIKVCERWEDPNMFLNDMGPRPSKRHMIERIDNDGDYEPSNCRWATPKEQANNKRTNVYVEYRGQRMTVKQLSELVGITYDVLHNRVTKGWSIEDAVSLEVSDTGPDRRSKPRRLHPPDQVVVDPASEGAERPAAPQNIRIGDAASSQENLASPPGVGVVA